MITVSGPDAASFLNSLLTQNVESAAGVQYAALLSPQGKVIADMLLWAHDGGFLIEADPARAEDLLRRLNMYKLRAAVRVEDVSGQFHALWARERFAAAAPDPRFPKGELGWREIRPATEQHAFADGGAPHDAHRLALGVPDLARDVAPEEVFALEALLEELHGVDFQKGCFVGQENVSRMKRRATTRKKLCPVVFEGEAPAFATPVLAGEAEIGSVRTGARGRAMALIRLDRALAGPELTAAGRPVRVAAPPWLLLPDPA